MLDLSMAQHAYKECYSSMPHSCRFEIVKSRNKSIAKPVEINVMIMLDQRKAEVQSIEKKLNDTRRSIEEIEELANKANLSTREWDYLRFRYFSNLTAQATAQRMFCSDATCGRARTSLLGKIEKVMKVLPK